LKTLEWPTE